MIIRKFRSDILDVKIKQTKKKKSIISNLVKNSYLNTIIKTLAKKSKIKVKKDKIVQLQTHVLSYFYGNFFGDDGFQNMFVYQLTLDILELKEEKGIDYVTAWKSKGVYTSKLTPLYTVSCIA